jgi:LEA14-like dessication related protein
MALTPKQKKYAVAALLAVVSIAGAAAYLQYKKIMEYTLTFRSVKIKRVSLTTFDFDLYFNLENKADISYTIESQSYDVYLNNIFVTRLSNQVATRIAARAVSPLGLNVKFNPQQALQKLGFNITSMIKGNDKLTIKIDMKLKVKVLGLPINIPYVYEDTLKNMMSA